jgi:uncharacterized protein (TIGR00725 family)
MASHRRQMVGTQAAYVAVIGPGADATAPDTALAREIGRRLAAEKAILVCGGLGGVMAAACQGAAEAHGLTVGLLPGGQRSEGNPYLSVALPTGLGELRNGLVVRASHAVIAIGGSWGTLSEIALAVRAGTPTILVGGWKVEDLPGRPAGTLHRADSAPQAVQRALAYARRKPP